MYGKMEELDRSNVPHNIYVWYIPYFILQLGSSNIYIYIYIMLWQMTIYFCIFEWICWSKICIKCIYCTTTCATCTAIHDRCQSLYAHHLMGNCGYFWYVLTLSQTLFWYICWWGVPCKMFSQCKEVKCLAFWSKKKQVKYLCEMMTCHSKLFEKMGVQ